MPTRMAGVSGLCFKISGMNFVLKKEKKKREGRRKGKGKEKERKRKGKGKEKGRGEEGREVTLERKRGGVT